MRGGSSARTASADTCTDVNFSRFLRRIVTTSVAVQLQRAISTSSIGPLADLSSPESTTIACPLVADATKRSPSSHWALAVVLPMSLSPVIGLRFRVDQHAEQLRRGILEADLEGGLHIVDASERQRVVHRDMTGEEEVFAHTFEHDLVN